MKDYLLLTVARRRDTASESDRIRNRYTRVTTVMYIRVVGTGSPADDGRAGTLVQHTPTTDRV
jgi:hypothetical protein